MKYNEFVNNYETTADAKEKCALPCSCSTCMYNMWATMVTTDYPAEAETETRCAIMKREIKNDYTFLISDESFEEIKANLSEGDEDDFYGSVHIGEICFDVVGRNGEIELAMFVGGIDNGYDCTEDGYPYDLIDYYVLEKVGEDRAEFERNVINLANGIIRKTCFFVDKANEPTKIF